MTDKPYEMKPEEIKAKMMAMYPCLDDEDFEDGTIIEFEQSVATAVQQKLKGWLLSDESVERVASYLYTTIKDGVWENVTEGVRNGYRNIARSLISTLLNTEGK